MLEVCIRGIIVCSIPYAKTSGECSEDRETCHEEWIRKLSLACRIFQESVRVSQSLVGLPFDLLVFYLFLLITVFFLVVNFDVTAYFYYLDFAVFA